MNQPPLNPDVLKVALEWLATAVREVEVKFADDGTRPGDYWTGYREAKSEIADLLAEPELIKKATRVALAAALPEVTSVEELEALPVGSVLMELSGAGRAGVKSRVNGVFFAEELSEHMTFQVALPARVLHRPEVNDV